MTGKTVKRMIIMLVIVGVVLGAIFVFEGIVVPKIMKGVIASQANPPQTVSDTVAQAQDWQPQLAAIGSLRAVRGADLSLEVGGIVPRSISTPATTSGRRAAARAVVGRRPRQARIAQGASRARAITYERDQRQFKAQAVSKQAVDTDAARP